MDVRAGVGVERVSQCRQTIRAGSNSRDKIPNSRPRSVGFTAVGYITRVQSEHSMIDEEYTETEALACGGGRARLAAVRKTNSGC